MNNPGWPKLDQPNLPASAFLRDADIQAAMDKGLLLTGGDKHRAKYACYELVIGTKVEQLVPPDGGPGSDLYRVKDVSNGSITIQPGETFKVYAAEQLNMPADVFALAIPVGVLYKLGLNPETTFADPGFRREFFVTLANYSNRIVTLKVGDPLARMFFCRLGERPERIHDSVVRDTPHAVSRVQRPTDADLGKMREDELLRSVLEQVDPPHFQHAYVTNRLLLNQFAELGRRTALVTVMGFVGMLLIVTIGTVEVYRAWEATNPTLAQGTLASLIANALWAIPLLLVPRTRRVIVGAAIELLRGHPRA